MAAVGTLWVRNPIPPLTVALIVSAIFKAPIEAVAGLWGTALASVLKDQSPKRQWYTIIGSTVLYAHALTFTHSIFQDLLVGFLIVLTIKGCFVLW